MGSQMLIKPFESDNFLTRSDLSLSGWITDFSWLVLGAFFTLVFL